VIVVAGVGIMALAQQAVCQVDATNSCVGIDSSAPRFDNIGEPSLEPAYLATLAEEIPPPIDLLQ
jgi:hypothetical protein